VKFEVFMGEPEMLAVWNDLLQRGQKKELSGDEIEFFDKWSKSVELLRPIRGTLAFKPMRSTISLASSASKFGKATWRIGPQGLGEYSGRMAPTNNRSLLLAVERHPESAKRKAYERIKLSRFPATRKKGRDSG
jgi:hypothetical protein